MLRPLALGLALSAIGIGAQAQTAAWPTKPITLVVPFAAGGPTDVLARILGQWLSQKLGQQFLVANVTGAGGTIGATQVARAPKDGYTAIMGNLGTHSASVGLYKNLAYDPRTDFAPVGLFASTPMVVATRKNLEVANFKEFMALMKERGDKLTFGTGGVGSTSHLTCILLNSLLGTNTTHIPYRGNGPAMNDLVAGQLDFTCDQTVSVVPQIQGGTIKPMVIAVKERFFALPNVPTSIEAGLPAFQATGWNALFLPVGSPPEIVAKLNATIRESFKDANVMARLAELGAVVPPPEESTPEALAALVRSEVDRWVPMIHAAGAVGE